MDFISDTVLGLLNFATIILLALIVLLVIAIIYGALAHIYKERQYRRFKQQNSNKFFLIYDTYKQFYFEQELQAHFEKQIDFVNVGTNNFTPIRNFATVPRFIFHSMHREAVNYTTERSPYLCFVDIDNRCKAISLRTTVANDFQKKQARTRIEIQKFLDFCNNRVLA